MTLAVIDRGNTVLFTSTPVDVDGNAVMPASVTLHLSYPNGIGRTLLVISMTPQSTDGPWIVEWDSTVSGRGIVYYSVRALDPNATEDGDFMLEANVANTV
jgi:hypothetical protein